MQKGFIVTLNRKHYILISDKVNITDDIVRKFIVKILEFTGVEKEVINTALRDRQTLDRIKNLCERCTLETKETYYSISGKYFLMSIPFTDKEVVIFN